MRNATKILLVLAAVMGTVGAGACVNSEQVSSQPPGQPQYTAPKETEAKDTETSTPSESAGTTGDAAAGPECTVDDIAVAGEPGAAPQVTLPTTCAPPTTLLTKDLVVGTGAEAVAGSTMQANYHLVTWSNGQVADSSFQTGQPIPLENVGATEGLIAGWNEGVVGMHEGGRRLLVVPPDKGYGEQGRAPKVGPNETLVFVIEATTVTPV